MIRELVALLVFFGGMLVLDNAETLQCIVEDSHSDTCMMLLHGGNGDPEPVDCKEYPADDPEYCG